jgi:hypothetical protein
VLIVFGFHRFAATIGALENLVELNLCENELTSLPPQIKGLSMLVSLLLNRNQLKELPDEIGELRYLLILEVGMNKLKKLPRSIGNLTNLDKVHLNRPASPIKSLGLGSANGVWFSLFWTSTICLDCQARLVN